jgi:hypothetical protein
MNVTTQEFAAAVANLAARLGRMPTETELSSELRWTDSHAALIALGQESQAVGLVKVVYQHGASGGTPAVWKGGARVGQNRGAARGVSALCTALVGFWSSHFPL